ncbi:hypothetical protein [Nostoc flagelliforme]|uniref:hypothetical protein n=1 Tax=Nostoc flagelliforme TaxID=1306274 RepID=UPI001F55A618|nr:hypothetical protein [Nostoc flagelliforme]
MATCVHKIPSNSFFQQNFIYKKPWFLTFEDDREKKSKTNEYWQIVKSTHKYLAEQALQQISQFLDRNGKREHYEFLSAGALA